MMNELWKFATLSERARFSMHHSTKVSNFMKKLLLLLLLLFFVLFCFFFFCFFYQWGMLKQLDDSLSVFRGAYRLIDRTSILLFVTDNPNNSSYNAYATFVGRGGYSLWTGSKSGV